MSWEGMKMLLAYEMSPMMNKLVVEDCHKRLKFLNQIPHGRSVVSQMLNQGRLHCRSEVSYLQ